MLPDRLEQQSLEQGVDVASALARLSTRAKLLAAAALMVAVSLVPPGWLAVSPQVPVSWAHVLIGVVVVVAVVAARMSWMQVLRRWITFLVPLVLIGLSIPLTRGAAGWPIMAAVIAKGLLSFTILMVLVHTTGFDRLLLAMRQCGVPKLFVAMLAAMYRYLFVLLDELERMRRAQYARTFNCPRRLSPVTVRNGTRLVGILIVRCSERAERVHAAMVARGFDGEIRTLDESP